MSHIKTPQAEWWLAWIRRTMGINKNIIYLSMITFQPRLLKHIASVPCQIELETKMARREVVCQWSSVAVGKSQIEVEKFSLNEKIGVCVCLCVHACACVHSLCACSNGFFFLAGWCRRGEVQIHLRKYKPR